MHVRWLTDLIDWLHIHDVKIVRDIIVPIFSVDKIAALIGIIYIARTFTKNNQLARTNFIHQLTLSHRDIWSQIHKTFPNSGGLEKYDPATSNLDVAQKRCIINLILHVKISYEAHRSRIMKWDRGVCLDLGKVFNYPAVDLVWESIKELHEKDFKKKIQSLKELARNPPLSPLHQVLLVVTNSWDIGRLNTLKRLCADNFAFFMLAFLILIFLNGVIAIMFLVLLK
jgi:hypothetical protein